MRPRSRLLSKRRLLLPTIREATEETLRDLNEANTLHIAGHGQAVSSEDYLLSICHLAHPTFPNRGVSPDNIHTRQLGAVHQRLRLSRLSGTTSTTFEFSLTEEANAIDVQQGNEKELNGELMFGNSDPLEYLYGHQNNLSGGVGRAFVEERFTRQHGREGQACSRAYSIPCASSPDLPHHCKSSCPDLHSTISNISPKHNFSRLEARRGIPADRGAEAERQNPTIRQSLISQWISDCRSAWREARVRACMLPAIAEI
ncbi:hypothetical protein PFLUV_G00122010 [Perca fluviatilis]|uniref:Uncharacterized protein n=1 Tax=Perca fluviatilis TaxID=8168 RepID=A0A6A5F9J9_PERFL|nr:uncharacterized protein si:dkeyp-72g9.4 [Perca fluviatilis]KAF1384612.1 hypothetical protein PFLUV_G00122010 [Perca fluviatilis]